MTVRIQSRVHRDMKSRTNIRPCDVRILLRPTENERELPARLILRSLLRGQTLRGLTLQNNPASLRTPQEPRNRDWRNPAKMDKCQLCSVRRFGHRAVGGQMSGGKDNQAQLRSSGGKRV